MIARRVADALISVLLAPPCAACGASLPEPTRGAVCAACWSAIPAMPGAFCVPGVDLALAAGPYDGSLREIVHAFKYQKRRSLARPLAALIARRCGAAFDGADCVVPVPLHAARRRARGFNQAALLAAALPLACLGVLRRVRATPSQTDLPASARRANVMNAFELTRDVDARCVVLVDDVTTTGATLGECARVLKSAGVVEVRAVTIARKL